MEEGHKKKNPPVLLFNICREKEKLQDTSSRIGLKAQKRTELELKIIEL